MNYSDFEFFQFFTQFVAFLLTALNVSYTSTNDGLNQGLVICISGLTSTVLMIIIVLVLTKVKRIESWFYLNAPLRVFPILNLFLLLFTAWQFKSLSTQDFAVVNLIFWWSLPISGLICWDWRLEYYRKPDSPQQKKVINLEKVENMQEKPNKTMKLRNDFYSIAFIGYIYVDDEQRKEIILDEDQEEEAKIEDEKTEEEKREDRFRRSERKKKYFRDPLTGEQRKLSFNEAGRNFVYCFFIFLIQMTLSWKIFEEISQDLKSS